ncbi:zinc finger protein 14 isoform X2 [Cherax quadricarinatus]|uniref:zinc finger protein 14 isoform X2 n=1 Tax=Cherax quadricarinatus TaxID=27406 RepID=UPI002378206C|nr:zinc finger protein 117-like isoform X2 [Cherax quadricarinatus]
MATSVEYNVNSFCLVCNKIIKEALVNIHSNLATKNHSIHSQISRVVSVEDLLEACQTSEVVCSTCLKILLNIINLESQIVTLKNEFRETFQHGLESRRSVIGRSLMVQDKPRGASDDKYHMEYDVCANSEWNVDSSSDCPVSTAKKQLANSQQEIVKPKDFDQSKGSIVGDCSLNEKKRGTVSPLFTSKDNLDVSICTEDVKNSTESRSRRSRTKQPQHKRQMKLRRDKRKKVKAEGTNAMIEANAKFMEDFEDDWPLEAEESTQGSNTMITCELCGERFNDYKQLGKHRGDVHASVYCHVCKQCTDTRYREKAKLTQHLRLIHKVLVHQCPACNHEASSQNSLDQHIISKHPDSRFFECHICHKFFRTYRYLNFMHIKRCHVGLPVKYTCEKCNKGFVDKTALKNHKFTHSEVRNYTCKFCGAMFHTPYNLNLHINTHTQEKKYVCVHCGSAFLRPNNLCAHKKRFHSSGDAKLICEVCGKSMDTPKALRRHKLTHHSKPKPLACHQFPNSYTGKGSPKHHLGIHTGEKPLRCTCGKSFHKSSALSRHQRWVHVDEFQQDSFTENDECNTVEVGDDIEDEEHMVVITLKECNPPAVYNVQKASAHLQEIMISNGTPPQPHSGSLISENFPLSQDTELPLLHPQLGSLATGRIGLSTPVVFTTLSINPISVEHSQDIVSGGLSPAMSIDSGLQAASLPFQQTPVSGVQAKIDPMVTLPSETPVTCPPLATQLLQLPPLQTSTASNAPVTFISTWPSAL